MSDAPEGTVTAGSLLREARQAAGMHIAALAVALKVPVSKLEALEADNHEALPDTVFVRALASSVCRTLKVDPAPVLSLLPQSQSPRLAVDSAGLNAPMKGSAGHSKAAASAASFSGSTSRSVSLVVLALLVGAAALFFYPRHQNGEGAPPVTVSDGAAPQPDATPAPVMASPAEQAPTAPAAPVSDEPRPAESNSAPVASPSGLSASAVAAGAALPPGLAANASAVPASAAELPEAVLVLRASGESWVQVRDSKGAVVLQRSLAQGETASAAGSLPLAVVVGRADATQVYVRGKPFDLSAVSRENVARFEVR